MLHRELNVIDAPGFNSIKDAFVERTASQTWRPNQKTGTNGLLSSVWSDMTITQSDELTPQKQLRLWPG
ncbi:MAG: hypothetical protein HW416_2122, partial [Chloroflexi bacterium]|nr:hypothetical protein [Chloroflexota bacterium]